METSDKRAGWLSKWQDAEVPHTDQVWEGIEIQLDKAEVRKLRKSVFIYKCLAAASVSLALLSGVFTYWVNLQQDPFTIALAKVETPAATPSQTLETFNNESIDKNAVASTFKNGKFLVNDAEQLQFENGNVSNQIENENSGSGFQVRQTVNKNFGFARYGESLNQFGGSSSTYKAGIKPNVMLPPNEGGVTESPLLQHKEEPVLAGTDLMNKEVEENAFDKKNGDKFWTSLGFAAGTFSNATPTSPSAPATSLRSAAAGQTAASESNSPGYTYAVNVMVGTKVSDKWVLQGGMSYISQTSDYTATTVVSNPNQPTLMAASINQFEKQDDTQSSILSTSPYTVNNNIQMISFPLQAGLILMDRKVGFLINSGFSTDLFLQNTITPQVESLEKSTQGRGDESPYKPLNVSGLFGSEVSYRFGENYRISLAPGFRYPFSSIYKSDLGIKSSPLTFDVALRFRYILK